MGEPALILLAAAAGGLGAAAAREAIAATPALAQLVEEAVEPLRRAGREGYSPSELERRRLALLGTGGMLTLGLMVAGPGPAVIAAIGGPAMMAWAVSARRRRYRVAVERAMPEIARAVADAMAGGRSVRAALASAAGAARGQAGVELSRVAADLEVGASSGEALAGLRRRVASPRVDAFATALLSQQAAGGDLATLLRRYAEASAEEDRTTEDARTATTQARFTGLLVIALPGGAALFAELLEPRFVSRVLADSFALVMLVLAAALQLAGFALIRRLGTIRR